MDNGASSYRRFLEGDESAFDEIMKELFPDDMRVVIHLIYFEDLSYDEAGKVMKKSRKQVDNLLYRAKKELRIILGKDGELLL